MSSRVIVIIAVGIVILGAVFLVAGIVIGFSGVMDGVVNERIKEVSPF